MDSLQSPSEIGRAQRQAKYEWIRENHEVRAVQGASHR
jgi:hypothetical protein